jgi:hypothetical protein
MIKNFRRYAVHVLADDDSTGTIQYGVDMVNNSSTPATDFEINLLYYDNDQPYKEKLAKKALSTWDTLPSGVSLNMKYKMNKESSWHLVTDDTTMAVTSGTVAQINIGKQFIGLEIGIDGTCSGATSPVL